MKAVGDIKKCCNPECLGSNPQPLNNFYKDKHAQDGLSSYCRVCSKIKTRKYANKNPEKISVSGKLYRKEHREELAVYHSAYQEKYYAENHEAILEYHANYRSENKEVCGARIAKWGKNNPGKRNAITAKYRASKLQATPKWLTKQHFREIREFYIEAARITEETGIPHHVDHILPLQGETVRG